MVVVKGQDGVLSLPLHQTGRAVQQLSRQDHYDFGLRALTSLLRYAGKKRRLQPDLSDEEVD